VQGNESKYEIANAVEYLNANYQELDVLLVGRGGGSLEDLWAFNEEIVARAIFNSKIPVISCVGHR
jgi:exodeoxyribonuclease VII large subunit